MEGDIELIKEIMPNVDEAQIRKVLADTGEFGLAVRQLLFPGSPVGARQGRTSKRTIVSIHSDCSEVAIEATRAAIASVRSAELSVSEFAPESTISVSFQGNPCKPMIYVEPRPLDAQFCENIEPMSVIITEEFENIEVRTWCSFNSIVVLPFTHETVLKSVQQVLVANGIVAGGFPQKKFGDLWHEMLCMIPLIQGTYAEAIAASVPSPYCAVHNPLTGLVSKGGHRVPERILKRLRLFFETDDPNERLETRNVRRPGTDDT
jgi:hypothetical protein